MAEEVVPLPLVYSTLLVSILGVFGNLTIVLITVKNRSLHTRCTILISILAFFDLIVCVHLVQLRLLMVLRVYHIANSTCFYQSVYGIFAMNMQSIMGLFIGIDRLCIVSCPVKYSRIPLVFYAVALFVCLVLSLAVVLTGLFFVSNEKTVAVCLPVTALNGFSLRIWLGTNFAIAVSVLFVYGWTHVKCRALKANHRHAKSMDAVKRILKSLAVIIALYVGTWFLAITSLFLTDILKVEPWLTAQIQTWVGWFVVCNSSLHVFVYFWRTPEYRKAILRFYGFGARTENSSRIPVSLLQKSPAAAL